MRIPLNKPFRIFVIALLSTITLIAVTSAIVSLFYEKAVIRYMKKYLDEHLLTQITMDDIRFRALKGFPNATVEISHAVILSGDHFSTHDFRETFADTLLKARKVSFQFDLIMLFHKNYEIKKVEIRDGSFNILFDKKGMNNLHVWKSNEIKGQENYSLNLRGISVSNVYIRLIDLNNHINMDALARKTSFRGSYANNILSGDAHGTFTQSSLLIRNNLWMHKADLEIQAKLMHSIDRFRIRQGIVKVNKAQINLQGEYREGKEKLVDLSLEVPKFGLGEFISLLPIKNDSLFVRYHFTGGGSLKATLKGSISNPDHLQIRSDFDLSGCTARNMKSGILIKGINAKGNVSGTNAANFRLNLSNFNSTLGKGNINGTLQITNLRDMMLHARINSYIDLDAIQDFADLKTVKHIGGMIRASFDAEGKMGLIRRDSMARLMNYLKKGVFVFEDAGFEMTNSGVAMEHVSGKATLDGPIYLENMNIRINGNDFRLDGKVYNLNGYLLSKGILRSDLAIVADNFSMNRLLRYEPGSPSGKRREPVNLFPERMHMNAKIHTGIFDAGKFRATNATASLSLIGDSMYIPEFDLQFPDGTITGNAMICQNKYHRISVTCNSEPKHINIRQLFTSFNNFTQNFILDKNVNGSLDGHISFFAQWDSLLHFQPKTLKAKGNVVISDGELVQFAPMLKLSKYINVDELKLIRFRTLKNEIFIQDRLVSIPEMAIYSSAFNISVSGHQTFDNLFEYRLNVLLSEVLFNKARKKKKEMDEFLVIDNLEDQTTIPLILAGTPDNFDVKFDRKRAFSLGRKKMNNLSKVPDSDNFRIDWDEKKESVIQSAPLPSGKKQDDFKIEWDEDENTDKNDL